MSAGSAYLAYAVGILVIAAAGEAFTRGAGRRYPTFDQFVVAAAWILGTSLVALLAITATFLALGAWG